jgi:hypothetical protein
LSSAIADLQVDSAQEAKLERSSSSTALPNAAARLRATGSANPPEQPFYFYQALPHFYLSPLDIRILKSEYGDFSSFPPAILPRVEHISTGHLVDDDLRKRAKYLGHLPYGCEVHFLECDWTDLVSPAVLATFSKEIGLRQNRNREKEAREEKERIRAEREDDDKRWATARRKRSSFTDEQPFSANDFRPLGPGGWSDSVPGESSGQDGHPDMEWGFSSTSPPPPSASQSRFIALASPSTSPSAPRTVWGTAAVGPNATPPHSTPRYEFQNTRDDGWLQGWEKNMVGEKGLVSQAFALEDGGGGGGGGAGKKKKKQKITLMSTNARRGA